MTVALRLYWLPVSLELVGSLFAVPSVVISAAVLVGKLMGALACLAVDVYPSILVLVPFSDPRGRGLWWAVVGLLLGVVLVLALALGVRIVVSEFVDNVVEEGHVGNGWVD